MSMLAERKRKQKWSLNPRGKEWSSDSNKFGQKLLEKMGWSAGKGLGAKEDGITEHVKVLYKNDSKGMGFKESDDQWTSHETDFSDLLNSLSDPNADPGTSDDVLKVESLEKKSQKSRARVHYSKFTRGKDLSRYSEKDLANIFGRKELKKKAKEVQEELPEDEGKKFGVETKNGGNMKEYFKKKMPNFMRSTRNSESDEERPSFGFGFKPNVSEAAQPSFVSYVEEDNENGNCSASSKENGSLSNRKRSHSIDEPPLAPLKKKSKKFETLNMLEDDVQIDRTPKKKSKKKSKKRRNSEEKHGILNPVCESISTILDRPLEDIPEENEEEICDETKVDVKMTDNNNCAEEKVKTPEQSGEENEWKTISKKKKSKKRKNSEQSDDSKTTKKSKNATEGCVNVCFEDSIDEVKLKKSKKAKKTSEGFENPGFEDLNKPIEGLVNVCFEDSIEEVKPRKSKKSKETLEEVENVSAVETKISKKARKSEGGVENSAFNDNDNEACTVEENNGEFEVKRKNKKRKRDAEDGGIANPCFEDNYPEDNGKNRKKKKKTHEPDSKSVDKKESEIANIENILPDEDCDLLLNVVSTPTEERKSLKESESRKSKKGKNMEKNVHSLSKQLDECQAAIENDINQAKETYIGEDVQSDGEDAALPNGEIKLKLKNAKFGKTPKWLLKNKDPNNPKSSYRHLIKGDVVLGFKNTNLHEIRGYDPRKSS